VTGVERVEYMTPDGFRLAGLVTVPDPSTLRGWAVMTHGILESKDEYGGFYVDIAAILAERGIGSLRFDFRGHGESSGSTMDISIVGDVIDLKSSVKQLPLEIDEPVALVGTSFGAGPSILAASGLGRRLSCIALIAPVLDYERTFLHPSTPWAMESFTVEALRSLDERGYLLLGGDQRLSPRLIEEFRLLRPYEVLSHMSEPCLIIHGDKDSMVPYDTSAEASRGRANISLQTLKGADHGFTDSEDDTDTSAVSLRNRKDLVESISSFVAEHAG
jgi:pimeloyl-ACP methyl ester carboxylesterase